MPSRRTRDPEEVSVAWQIDAYRFELPILAAPMDSVMSPETAIAIGQLGGLGVLDLEGLWTRYDDPSRPARRDRLPRPAPDAARRMQEIYAEPIKAELIVARIQQVRDAGVTVAGAPPPRSAPSSSGRPSSTPALTCSSSAAPRSAPSTSSRRPSR